ncbi:hypothetical protein RB195_004124 [Necator americanus]|uniref:BZIP domain-containing protein n=1 Tax=Necator americanus TaxID=51031 RepID=A0ABR1BI93_NECAM
MGFGDALDDSTFLQMKAGPTTRPGSSQTRICGSNLANECWSTEQAGALRPKLLHKVYPGRDETNALGSNAAEENPSTNLYLSPTSASDFNQEKRRRRKFRRQLQQNRDNEWTSRAK